MVNDTISDMLTRIRNACMVKKSTVLIPFTKMNKKISQILEKEGFIQSFLFDDDLQMLVLKLKYNQNERKV
jgi:small subunit ribosomal protein S8